MAADVSGGVLLTGATGLVGSWVVRHWPAAGPALHPVGSSHANLLDPAETVALLDRAAPTDVVHLAWSASGCRDYRHSADNARWLAATLALATAVQERGVRLWLTGTVVDDLGGGDGEALDAYTSSKSELRRAVAADVDAGTIGWLRPSYVVDETRRRPALVAQALDAARSGEVLELRTPTAMHDFVHASDVGAAVVLAVTHGLRGYLPIGSGRLRPVTDLVDVLGARWQAVDDAPTVTHAQTPTDVRWLAVHGWTPNRTRELFGDD